MQSPNATAQEIAQAWEKATRDLAHLREAVLRATEMAQLKVEQNAVGREKDRAFRDFGEAVWGQVKAGALSLPASLSAAVKQVQEVDKKVEAHQKDVMALLDEGTQAASRLTPSRENKGAAVAPKSKKR